MTRTQTPARPIVRALFLDVDGTLVGTENTISSAVRQALTTARERGCEIVLCTGRARHTAEPIAAQLPPPPGYAVTSNGGVAMHLGTGEVLYRHLLPVSLALEIVRAIFSVGATPYVYEDSTGPGVEAARVLYHPDRPTSSFAVGPRYRPHVNILEHLPFEPVSVCSFGTAEQMRPLARQLEAQLSAELCVIESGTKNYWGVEVFAAGVNKRLGLETIAARLEVDRREVMAIGDHFNDLEMIRWAGIGVAMGNAPHEIQAAADWVTGTVDADGVAQAIARYVL